jgi:hypothetical protein
MGELRGDVVAIPSSGHKVCGIVTGGYLVLVAVIVMLNVLI